ncbi:hypothetical protein AMTR_s05739p00004020, partial [Amborella trichopoda]
YASKPAEAYEPRASVYPSSEDLVSSSDESGSETDERDEGEGPSPLTGQGEEEDLGLNFLPSRSAGTRLDAYTVGIVAS